MLQEDPTVSAMYSLLRDHKSITVYLSSNEKLTISEIKNERLDVLVGKTWNGTEIVVNPRNILYALPQD